MSPDHWLAVGQISDAARQALVESDSQVIDVSSELPVVLVGLHYEDNWRTEHAEDDLQIWTSGDVHVKSRNLDLYWHNHLGSLTESRLQMPEEELPGGVSSTATGDELGDLDEAPF
jgi:hypothetical protein